MHFAPARRFTAAAAPLLVCALAAWVLVAPPAGAQSVDSKRAEARQIAQKLDELQSKQMELGARYERANYELHLARQRVAEAQAQADEMNAELERRRAELRAYAVSAYAGGEEEPAAAALFSGGASTGVVKRFYIETTSGNRGDLIDALKAAQRAADEEAARLAEAQEEAERHLEEIERARAEAAEATAAQEALNQRVQGELAALVAQEAAAAAARNPVATSTVPAGGAAAPAPTAAPPRGGGGGGGAPAAPPPAPAAPAPPGGGSKAAGAISAALSKVGSGYVWGAAGPNVFDCSGLVMWAYAQVGVRLPHYSGAQYAATTRISAAQLQPGDLVFWGPGGSEHVAIYMGGNQIVHAFSSARSVQVTHLHGWWKPPSGYGRLHY